MHVFSTDKDSGHEILVSSVVDAGGKGGRALRFWYEAVPPLPALSEVAGVRQFHRRTAWAKAKRSPRMTETLRPPLPTLIMSQPVPP
jgi:hypothetical protein